MRWAPEECLGKEERPSSHEGWAHLRFSVVGGLLASPPGVGELRGELERLAEKSWRHPISGEPVRFGVSTLERWYYAAKRGLHPVRTLQRKLRKDSGRYRAVTDRVSEALRAQYRDHPTWSYKLHRDNVIVIPELAPYPSYPTLRRFMASQALLPQPRKKGGARRTVPRQAREVRSFENAYVGGLWHLDFHHGSLKVLTGKGRWVTPLLLAILDDRSRLICHLQWYLDETAESLIHGLTQAFLKRGLPRSLLSDNGSAMLARETRQGLARLSIKHATTLPYSPHQNGKQENLWNQVEGRLLAMLENHRDLSLPFLNQASLAWAEMEYHHAIHSEINEPPLSRWLNGPSVARPCFPVDELKQAFSDRQGRNQRMTDGTLSVKGVRFEVPARFRHMRRLYLRYASWDLTHVWLVDERTEAVLARIYPLDKVRNSDGFRGVVEPLPDDLTGGEQPKTGIAPLLRKLMTDYAATGLPPAYIPKENKE
jgi:putative transposase